jgi:BNR/Asp-box repeat.
MDSDDEPQSHSSTSRLRRALTLGALSILALSIAGLTYLHPTLDLGEAGARAATSNVGSRHLAAVDFVTPATGWVVVEHQAHDFVVLRTSDAGGTWNRQLAGPAEVIGEYLRFFDASNGLLVVLGTQAALYRTNDGGNTWSRQPLTRAGGYVLSADFIDADHGWLLAQASTEGEALLRTDDGGRSWIGLGSPVAYSDWAYRVLFSDPSNGWLYSESTGPYAYKSQDGGTSWHRVDLPAPPGGWPVIPRGSAATARMFVAAHPTQGAGVSVTVGVASSDGVPPGGALQDFPVYRAHTSDGSGSTTSVYADVGRSGDWSTGVPSPSPEGELVQQFQLSSIDGGLSWKTTSTPAAQGAVAYIDAHNWWWIGSGVQSKSFDAGGTWSPIRTLLVPAPLPESVQIIDAKHVWFGAMVGPRPLVESSDDGGSSWTMVLLPATATG